ncbi:MAG: hypothetical protein ACI90V_008610, partial [Bacillariaceae sp.]|jgi:hypothetical protein
VVKRNAVKLKRKNDVIKNLKVQMVKEQQKNSVPQHVHLMVALNNKNVDILVALSKMNKLVNVSPTISFYILI